MCFVEWAEVNRLMILKQLLQSQSEVAWTGANFPHPNRSFGENGGYHRDVTMENTVATTCWNRAQSIGQMAKRVIEKKEGLRFWSVMASAHKYWSDEHITAVNTREQFL